MWGEREDGTMQQDGRLGPVEDLEQERRRVLAEIGRVEALLGKARMRLKRVPQRGLLARNLEIRERLKQELAQHVARLRTVNAAIKSGRRSGAALLLTGHQMPSSERELVSALYRLYIDAVPPVEQDAHQRGVMQIARDFVMSGRAVFGRVDGER
jgi:hypothetical protein